MADKSLVMTFLNAEGSRASITLSGVKDTLTETEVSDAMDVVIAANIFSSFRVSIEVLLVMRFEQRANSWPHYPSERLGEGV